MTVYTFELLFDSGRCSSCARRDKLYEYKWVDKQGLQRTGVACGSCLLSGMSGVIIEVVQHDTA